MAPVGVIFLHLNDHDSGVKKMATSGSNFDPKPPHPGTPEFGPWDPLRGRFSQIPKYPLQVGVYPPESALFRVFLDFGRFGRFGRFRRKVRKSALFPK